MADIKAGDNRYPIIMMKQNYMYQNGKSNAATQFQDRPRVSKLSITNNQQAELQNKQYHLQEQHKSKSSPAIKNEVKDRITKSCEEDNKSGKILQQLVKKQSAPIVDTEVFDGNALLNLLQINVKRSS